MERKLSKEEAFYTDTIPDTLGRACRLSCRYFEPVSNDGSGTCKAVYGIVGRTAISHCEEIKEVQDEHNQS